MIVRIASRINVDGQWWDITSDHIVDDNLSPAAKVLRIKATIRGLSKCGEIISRVGGNISNGKPTDLPPDPVAPNGVQSPLFTWPIPHCAVHSEEMATSKVQNNPVWTSFYCPKRHGQGYCLHRAKVDNRNGMPTLFEVKQ